MRAPCSIEGCEKESKGRGWCGTHWVRWRKYGDPMHVNRVGVDYMVKGKCQAEGCTRPNHAHDLCDMHLRRYQKHGDTETLGQTGRPPKGDVPSWHAIHKRLSRERGPASQYACVDCGDAASEWSYDHKDASPLYSTIGRSAVPYSLDAERYEPRCVPCHRRFDRAGEGRGRDDLGRFVGRLP